MKRSENSQKILNILMKYLIRRFFRIYIVYCIFVSIFSLLQINPKAGNGKHFEYLRETMIPKHCTWFEQITLKCSGMHLWKIPIERTLAVFLNEILHKNNIFFHRTGAINFYFTIHNFVSLMIIAVSIE